MPANFVHLRSHSEYSITESVLRVEDLIAKVKEDGQPACAITDPNSMFGAIRFFNKARTSGVKPIIGVDFVVQGNPDAEGNEMPSHRVLLLCKNYAGYRNLMQLVSKAYSKNMQKGTAMLREDWLEGEGATEGLICVSGDESGLVGSKAVAGDIDGAVATARRWESLFPGRYFLELQRRGVPEEAAFVEGVAKVSELTQIPLVATHPMQFIASDDYVAHEVKVCDKRKDILHDRQRARDFTPEQCFKTEAEMRELFSDIPEAVDNTMAVASMCNLDIPLGRSVLPDFQAPDGLSLEDYFVKVSKDGLEQRLAKLYPNVQERDKQRPRYEERLEMEMGVIKKMGFEGYFMIVYDFIAWAKEHDIPVGPGRGSGAGSLVAYSLKITDLDPLKYDLLFERFLNPERVSMPDFDIDFCKDRRELVIDYVSRRYGSDAVAGIANINTLQARAAVKAAGRVLAMHISFVEGLSKMIPSQPGQEITIEDALEQEPALRERYENESEARRLIDYARRIEGVPHAIGQHAAGVIIARGKLTDFTPLYIPEGKTQPVSQFDKDDVEKAGLVKFDFLGLKTLTELDHAVKLIQKTPDGKLFDLADVPLDDKKVFELFQTGDTISVFQFESPGMQRLLKEACPDRFDDLVALNALYRPGPMDLIPSFNDRKHGREKVVYADPRLQPILGSTYGIMIYQEQVMQIAQVIGGYSLGEADLLRRAMGKKKPEEMAKHRAIFVAGAAVKNVSEENATKLYDMMEKFAGYGFNKSHAAAYSLVAYQSAYLKTHYPAAFYSSMMTIEGQEDTASIPPLVEDAKRHGLRVTPPSINSSGVNFEPDPSDPSVIGYGFSCIKGLGKDAADHIVVTRQSKGDYTSLADFCEKIGKGHINKRGIEILIKAGTFDALHPNRAEALEALPKILKYYDDLAKRKPSEGPIDELFGSEAKSVVKKRKVKEKEPLVFPEWPTLPEQPLLARLAGENDAFGFYYSGHPYTHFEKEMGGFPSCTKVSDTPDIGSGYNQYWIPGVISEVKLINAKNGKMAIVKLEDDKGAMEVKVFNNLYESVKDLLKPKQFIMFAAEARDDTFRGGVSFLASEAKDLTATKTLLADNLNVALPPERVSRLAEMAAENPGDVPLLVWHPNGDTYARSKEAVFSVSASQEFFDSLSREFGEKHVKFRFKKSIPAPARAEKPGRGGWKSKR